MNVGQLINLLEEFPEDMEVQFAYNYGDHWKTTVAEHIGDVVEARVAYSQYHNRDAVLDDDAEDEDARPCVVIM